MADPTEHLRLIKYTILQSTTCVSLICDIFVFIYFIRHWKTAINKSPHNHLIICLLLVSFIQKVAEVPLILYYFRWGVSIQQTYLLCVIWNWLDYTMTSCPTHFLAWFCIERHLWIFHSQMMKKKWWLIILHYIPLIICFIYAPLFYMIAIFFPQQCANVWDYTSLLCGGPCYIYFNPSLAIFDALFNYGTPVPIIFFSTLLLFFRIIWQKINHRRAIEWRRQKWMIIQLTFISTLCLALGSPAIIVGVIQNLWSPTFAVDIQFNYFYYISYFINQLLPFIIVGSLPDLHKEVRHCIRSVKRRLGNQLQIHPAFTSTRIAVNTVQLSVMQRVNNRNNTCLQLYNQTTF